MPLARTPPKSSSAAIPATPDRKKVKQTRSAKKSPKSAKKNPKSAKKNTKSAKNIFEEEIEEVEEFEEVEGFEEIEQSVLQANPAVHPEELAKILDEEKTVQQLEEKVKVEDQNQPTKMEDLEVLVHKRGMAKGKLTKMLHTLLANVRTTTAILKVYQKKVDSAYHEYHESHDRILQLVSPAQREEQDVHFTLFDDLHMQVLTVIEEQMEKLTTPTPPVNSSPSTVPAQGTLVVKNPLKIPIPTFDGKYENWSKFKVMFKDLVDKTTDPAAVKLYHLDKSLVGSASGIIDAKTINEGNYQHAWKLLEERYENLRHMVDTHITGLFHLKKMTGEKCGELRALVDECTRHVENLKFLKQEFTGVSEQFVVHLLTNALDKETRRRFENTVAHGALPTYEAAIKFLKEQTFIMERCESSAVTSTIEKQQPAKKPAGKYPAQQSLATTSSSETATKCDFCGDSQHKNFKCSQFLSMTVSQRLEKVKEKRVCFNCLRKGHPVASCPSTGTCSQCKKRHNSLLHLESRHPKSESQSGSAAKTEPIPPTPQQTAQPTTQQTAPPVQQPSTSSATIAACSTGGQKRAPHVLLMTAVVDILDKYCNPHPCRVLLDSGSQVNIITKQMVDLLGLNDFATKLAITGVDGMQSRANRGVDVQLRSRYVSFRLNLQCFVTQKVTADLPTSVVDISGWTIPAGVQLADPNFYSPDKVDMLIGNQWFLNLLMAGKIQVADNLPTLCETKFGWVLGGAVPNCPAQEVARSQATTVEELNESIQRFWEVESVSQQFQVSTDEDECEKHFLETHQRRDSGRYVVQLPLKREVDELGDSRSLALRQFLMLEKRFEKQPDIKRQYVDFMDEYESLGHCKEVYEKDDAPELRKWYLPHHAVIRPSNTSTKCRVVFNGSACVASGWSLNEVMMIGAISQNDLLSIVLNFRIPQYVLSADVEKMYRQIDVAECHTPLQRVFWRKNPSDPLRILELTTVTYGTASAPFLATRALAQLAVDERARFPAAAEIVEKSFYVDNALFGCDQLDEALAVQKQLIAMMESGGFHLHKWSTNEEALLAPIPEKDREKLVSIHDSGVNEIIKTLGLMWKPDSDELLYLSLPTSDIEHPTKRQILSLLSMVFDPLGLMAPVIVIGKRLMQLVWKEKLDWDTPVSEQLLSEWNTFLAALLRVDQLRVPRRVVASTAIVFELHGFGDASEVAYGACVYIRSLFGDGTATMKLISAKSKIAPILPLSIPRKELLAALLLVRLVMKVLDAIKVVFKEMTLWSDNQAVLAWLKRPPEELEMYVRNRASEIVSQSVKKGFEWKYVNTKQNPADIVSRGLAADKLAVSDLWWNGPEFLRSEVYRMEQPPPLALEHIPELKPIARVHVLMKYDILEVFGKFESFRKLQRVIAYVLRFCHNATKKKEERTLGAFPTIHELRESMRVIVRYVQQRELAEEIQRVESEEPCKYLSGLSPFLDNGLLRVGGRLRHAKIPYDAKHQVILPHKSPVVLSFIAAIHREQLHVGPSGVMAALRQQFWVTNGRNTVRRVTRSCVRCFKQKPKLAEQYMGDLPSIRVESAPVFLKVGVDFAGPIMIRQGGRKAKPVKGYICVFVCLVTKAIHLEAVEDLSTAAFIAALQRFVGRRGVPETIWSDNGTNFVGARRELKDLYQMFQQQQTEKRIFEFCQTREITWKTIPPNAPHFGGLWEAAVKSVKSVLYKVLKQATLTIIEFATLLAQIEAILNSRPLFANSSDPNDPEALTPGHFLIGRPLTAIPEPSVEEIPANRLSRWQYLQLLREHFWKRWYREYIVELQNRGKWTRKHANIQPGMLAIIKEDNLPPQVWRLGKVEKVHPGDDKLVRVVDILSNGTIYQRPIHKLALLPILDNQPAPLQGSS